MNADLVKQTMNTAWNSVGMLVSIIHDGDYVERLVVDRRCMYGNTISLTLDEPLPGRTSDLVTVTPEDALRFSFRDVEREDHVHDWMEKPLQG